MTTYAITGARGFLGWHLRCRLLAVEPMTEVIALGRDVLNDIGRLTEALGASDVVFHLAGVNSDNADAAATNVELAELLAAGLARLADPPRVVYSNSSHADRETPYGQAKAAAATVLRRWEFADVVLPNLFGECGRPRYNSAVATFCEAVITGSPCNVDREGRTELLHAQDAAAALLRHVDGPMEERERVAGQPITIPDLYERLANFHRHYHKNGVVPYLATRFDLHLFNQLRVAMFPAAYPVELTRHVDPRGVFFEAARGSGNTQVSFSTTEPNITRGDHWHLDKVERFLVLAGTAVIGIRRLFDDTVYTFTVSGDRPAFVDMPTLHTHSITNVGDDELLTMFWANNHFDPAAPDTFAELVRRRAVVLG